MEGVEQVIARLVKLLDEPGAGELGKVLGWLGIIRLFEWLSTHPIIALAAGAIVVGGVVSAVAKGA